MKITYMHMTLTVKRSQKTQSQIRMNSKMPLVSIPVLQKIKKEKRKYKITIKQTANGA
jgi:hypothetical protein